MDRFQAEGSDSFIFLLSTRAGGLGITLTAVSDGWQLRSALYFHYAPSHPLAYKMDQ